MATPTGQAPAAALQWDIYCQVVDNYGDIGVCWRLAAQLAGRGQSVRLWVDDAAALQWMAPGGCPGVQVHAGLDPGAGYVPGDVVVEAFGVRLPAGVEAAIARAGAAGPRPVVWINLEYLSAQAYAARSHRLASPVLGGACAGVHKWFFFPGFTPDTGGLLRESGLEERRARFDRAAWLAGQGIAPADGQVFSLFCYEPPVLAAWLQSLERLAATRPLRLLVTHGRASAAVQAARAGLPAGWNARQGVKIHYLPPLTQVDFDHLLWSSDVNFVRGEDSLVRALWAGAPFIWQIYPQEDLAHHDKLRAFLDVLDRNLPPGLRRYYEWWNGMAAGPAPELQFAAWQPVFAAARHRLAAQTDLVTRLLGFVAENR
jgi:uncharacterized repeat protein (TIGR03837 family)